MTLPHVIHNTESQEYYFEEGCYILELANLESDSQLSIARARVAPNTATKLHKLSGTIERYIILSGNGVVILGENQDETTVTASDVVIIPDGCPQAIRNTGNDDLIFLVVCTTRFVTDNYSEC